MSINRLGKYVENPENLPVLNFDKGVAKGFYASGALTNLFRDSEPATLSVPFGAIISNVTFEANDWGIGLDGKAIFGDNSVPRQWSNTGNLSASTSYSLACIIKPNDGLTPSIGSTSSDICRFILSATTQSGTSVIALGNGLFFATVKGSTSGVNLTGNGLYKTSANNSVGFEASAIMVVTGNVDLTPYDYIKTVGTTANRSADNFIITDASGAIGTAPVLVANWATQANPNVINKGLINPNGDNYLNGVVDNSFTLPFTASSGTYEALNGFFHRKHQIYLSSSAFTPTLSQLLTRP